MLDPLDPAATIATTALDASSSTAVTALEDWSRALFRHSFTSASNDCIMDCPGCRFSSPACPRRTMPCTLAFAAVMMSATCSFVAAGASESPMPMENPRCSNQ